MKIETATMETLKTPSEWPDIAGMGRPLRLPYAPAMASRVSAASDSRRLETLLASFEPVTLDQMDAVKLLDRCEVKFLLPRTALVPLLAGCTGDHRVFTVAGKRMSRYRTLYYDTEDLALYLRHHAGAVERYKVRTREYVESRLAFLEVKHKVDPRRTVKSRVGLAEPPLPTAPLALRGQVADFVSANCPYEPGALQPHLWNYCTRITLVGKERPERVTLDLDLAFAWDGERTVLPGIVVAEVKYQGRRSESPFIRSLREFHIRETSFSKYCVGVSLLYPDAKQNRFKAKQRLVARLQQQVEPAAAGL